MPVDSNQMELRSLHIVLTSGEPFFKNTIRAPVRKTKKIGFDVSVSMKFELFVTNLRKASKKALKFQKRCLQKRYFEGILYPKKTFLLSMILVG